MNETHRKIRFTGLALSVGLSCLVSCLSSDDAPTRRHVEHLGPRVSAPPPRAELAPPSARASETQEPSEHPPSSADTNEPSSEVRRSALDEAIRKDSPSRPWSQNVPNRSCTDDGECGDGFCDRGRCAAIWTWHAHYGQRCEGDAWCSHVPCIDGRCRSCVSDAECTRFDIQDVKCTPDPWVPGFHDCRGVIGSGGFRVVPNTSLQKPTQ
jgi:hypothetical protein